MLFARFRLASLFIAAALIAAACQPAAVSTPQPTTAAPATAQPTDQAAPTATVAAEPTAALDPAAACPLPDASQALHVSRENGYCFLYPAEFKAQPDFARPQDAVVLQGPAENPGAMETIATTLSVAYNGPADGLDSAAYADRWKALYHGGADLPTQAITIGGQPAVMIEDLPGGYASQRAGLVVAGGSKYQVTALPQPKDSPVLAESVQRVWDTVTQSLVFFPPQAARPVVRAADICPAATADTQLWINEIGGFCLLFPADYGFDQEFLGRIIGGPVLAETTDWGQVRTSIFVAHYDQPPAALEQALTPPTEQIDPASVQQTTIGGAPAILYDFTGGPWRQRTAAIVANGSLYTMVGPWDAEQFPAGVAEAERLWGAITQSIVFFDKWR